MKCEVGLGVGGDRRVGSDAANADYVSAVEAMVSLPDRVRQASHIKDPTALAEQIAWRWDGVVVVWERPILDMLPADDDWWVPAPGGGGRRGGWDGWEQVPASELGDRVLRPWVATAPAGPFEFSVEVCSPGGIDYRLLFDGEVFKEGAFGTARLEQCATGPTKEDIARLTLLVEHSPVGIAVHQDGVIVYANATLAAMGGAPSPKFFIGRNVLDFIPPDEAREFAERVSSLKKIGQTIASHDLDVVLPKGRVHVESTTTLTTWQGRPAVQVMLKDVSDRRARQAVERRNVVAVSVLNEGIVVFGHDGEVVLSNAAAERVLGRKRLSLRGDDVLLGGCGATDDAGRPIPVSALPIRRALVDKTESRSLTMAVCLPGERTQWLSVSVAPIDDEDDPGAAAVCSVSDVTDEKERVSALRWKAEHDELTGLANRNAFISRLTAEMASGRTDDLAVLFFDLDHFKLVNDTFGHQSGDDMLVCVAQRLRGAAADALCIARLHGDEFAVLARTTTPETFAEHLLGAVNQPFELLPGKPLDIGASVGVATTETDPADQRTPSRLLQAADMAMLKAKGTLSRLWVFTPDLRDQHFDRISLTQDLKRAITNRELFVVFQPIVSLSEARIVGFEALVRWQHPTRGVIFPDKFIPLAEESDAICDLGEVVLDAACTHLAQWRADHPSALDVFVSVNVAARQLTNSRLVQAVKDVVGRTGIPPSALVIEITESAFVSDAPLICDTIERLRDLGVQLAIDDFGTGYASLGYLKRLPIDHLKIDRSFIVGLGKNQEDEQIVGSVTSLAHGLGMRIVVEGVEDAATREVASTLGCDLYQGYLCAKPMPASDVPGLWTGETEVGDSRFTTVAAR
jgi:diguanylate cyclase (GGDEF)-like protein/PAS domain S-box-containing protein